ncbi:PDZ domain-containing protein [Myxococcota bacterium]
MKYVATPLDRESGSGESMKASLRVLSVAFATLMPLSAGAQEAADAATKDKASATPAAKTPIPKHKAASPPATKAATKAEDKASVGKDEAATAPAAGEKAAEKAAAPPSWMLVSELSEDLADDVDSVSKMARSRVLATGVTVATDQAVEEARAALGMAKVTPEAFPLLIEAVEARHGVLVAAQTDEAGKVIVTVRRYDAATDVIATNTKVIGRAALKRTVKKSVNEILKTPKATRNKRGSQDATQVAESDRKIGLAIETLDSKTAKALGLKIPNGVRVTGVMGEWAAHRAGFETNDVILKIGRKKARNPGEVAGLLLQTNIGETLQLDVWRGGARTKVTLRIGPPVAEPPPPAGRDQRRGHR